MTKFVTLTDGSDLYDGLLDSPLEDVYVEGLFGDDTIEGTDLSDTLLGNQDSDVITGRRGDDLVYGGQGDDTIADAFDNNILLGNIGADSITGGIDADTIYGGPNDDTISGNSGPNLLLGNLDNDNITGGADEDTIYGGQGNDTISGQGGSNLLLGNKGDDNITGGAGEDTIYGGQGDDSISGDSGNNLLLGNIGDDSITGGENEDTIYGGQGLDSIVGNAGADLLLGNRGNDSISGGAGIDTIFGGAEDDSIFVLAEGDLESGESIDGGIGEDSLFVQANSSLDGVTLTSVENLVISEAITVTSSLETANSFVSISSIRGSVGILQITATEEEIIESGILDKVDGSVTVLDQDGNEVQGGMPTGVIEGTENADTITPEDVSDGVTGGMPGDGDDEISGLAGNDTIDGGAGNDTINGGEGADEITGGAGVDAVSAGAGDDVIILNEGDAVEGEVINGDDGTDILSVQGDSSLEGVTIATVENLVLADAVTVMSSLDQALGFESISAEDGATGTLQINATAEDIIASGVFLAIGDTITVLDENGDVVEPPVTDIIGTEEADLISSSEEADFQSTNGPDDIDALGGNDTVFGEGGNDTIVAGTGDDQAWGGTGIDSIEGGAGNDTLGIEAGDTGLGEVYDGGEDTDTILATGGGEIDLSETTVASVEELNVGENTTVIVSLDNIEDGGITTFSADIQAEDGVATIKILGTTAQVEGVLGSITIEGGTDSGIVVLNQDDEQVFPAPPGGDIDGTDGNDTLVGTDASERIRGFAGNDVLQGMAGNDTLEGGADNDTLEGGAGQDNSSGDAGNDNFRVNAGDVEAGELYDGGDDRDTMSVLGNSDLSIATLESIEVLDVAQGVTAIVSQANLDQGGSVDALTGSGTIRAAVNPDNPDEVVTLDLTGITVDRLLTIENSAGEIVQGPETDNPDDPDKLRPIVYTLMVGPDVTSFDGRADAPLEDTNIGTVPTLENGDNLEGAGENDVLTATLSTNSTVPVTPIIQPILRGIETVNISPFSVSSLVAPPTLRASQITGTNDFVSSDGNVLLNITDIPTIPENFILRNAFAGMNVTVRNSAISGSTDIANVTLENVQASGGVFTVAPVTGNNGFETVNIDSSTPDTNADLDNIIDRFEFGDSTTTTTVNITGTQNLELEANLGFISFPNQVTTINAGNTELGALTGDLTIGMAPTSNLTFTGGDGNDNIFFDITDVPNGLVTSDNLTADDVVDGGAGEENTVRAIYTVDAGPLNLSNIQNFYVDALANVSLNMQDVEGINKLRLENDTNGNANNLLTISSSKIAPTEIQFRGSGVVEIQNLDGLNLTSSVLTGNSDVVTINIDNRGNNLGDANSYNFNAGVMSINGYETINFNVADGNLGVTIQAGAVVDDAANGANIISASLETINFTGANIRVDDIGGTLRTINTIDASGVTGTFKAGQNTAINSLRSNAVVTLGQGASDFNASNSNPDQDNANGTGVTINGGDGNDMITGTLDNDTIIGGAGVDVIDVNLGNDRVHLTETDTMDTIDNLTAGGAGDKIGLSASTYGGISSGAYQVVNVATFNGGGLNAASTIIADTTNNLEQNLIADSSAVIAAYSTTNSTLYYSPNGNFDVLTQTSPIAEFTNLVGAFVGADFVPIP
jgi:Ca2+-binding RTX toxin-like protein